jgi:hypothetical protein
MISQQQIMNNSWYTLKVPNEVISPCKTSWCKEFLFFRNKIRHFRIAYIGPGSYKNIEFFYEAMTSEPTSQLSSWLHWNSETAHHRTFSNYNSTVMRISDSMYPYYQMAVQILGKKWTLKVILIIFSASAWLYPTQHGKIKLYFSFWKPLKKFI